MPSPEYAKMRKAFQPGLAVAEDPVDLVREKMHRIHPTAAPDDATIERLELGGVAAAFVSAPGLDSSDRVVFHVHGGAFVSTGITHYLLYAYHVSREVQARVLIHEYGLAPEHHFPTQIDQTLAVFRALLESGVAPERVAFTGDSCGCGIAVATMLALRDAGDPLPAAFASYTGWFDLEQTGDSALHPRGVDPFVEPAWIRRRGRDYVGEDGDPRDPRASVIYADLSGLPPMLLQCGGVDVTRDDATRLAAKAGGDGVCVTLEVWPDMIHGWHGLAALIPEGREALARSGEFLRRQVP